MPRKELTVNRANEVLRYDPATGLLYWRVSAGGAAMGALAGCDMGKGRIGICVDGRLYRAHRIAWLLMTGEWPRQLIDHKNLDPSDNRWVNLRQATPAQNNANCRRRSHNKSGFKGVFWNTQCRRWQARIRKGGKAFHLGLFDTPEEAHESYKAAAASMYGEFARAA